VLEADDGSLAAALAGGDRVTVEAADGRVDLGPEDVDLSQETEVGWGMASEGGLTVALGLDVTPELREEGLARDLLRVVQDARKAAGLDISDRIELAVATEGEPARALDRHRAWLGGEALAVGVLDGDPPWQPERTETAELDGTPVRIAIRRAPPLS
jgi:isoleucyl-tRNA synthetase